MRAQFMKVGGVAMPYVANGWQVHIDEHHRQHMINVRLMCYQLGIDAQSQEERLRVAAWARIVTMPVKFSQRDLLADTPTQSPLRSPSLMLDVACVPTWLMTIRASRVEPHYREALEQYQASASNVITNAVLGQPAYRACDHDLAFRLHELVAMILPIDPSLTRANPTLPELPDYPEYNRRSAHNRTLKAQ